VTFSNCFDGEIAVETIKVAPKTLYGTKKSRFKLSDDWLKRILLAPAMLIILGLVVYPTLWAVVLSFTNFSIMKDVPPKFIGLQNYTRILHDPAIWDRFAFTGKFLIVAVIIELLIGFAIAYFLHTRFRNQGILVTLLLLPMMLSPVIVGLFWKYMLSPNWGIVNFILVQFFHTKEILWLTTDEWGFWSIVIVDAWMWTPFMMLLSLAGLSAVPEYLYESAQVDRASNWYIFSRITLPLAAPLIILAIVFRTIDAFKTVDVVWVLTAGGPGSSTETISFTLYKLAFAFYKTGPASALAVIMLVTVIGMSNILIKALNNAHDSTQ
jgi:multiple sugar transport system permease protein